MQTLTADMDLHTDLEFKRRTHAFLLGEKVAFVQVNKSLPTLPSASFAIQQ